MQRARRSKRDILELTVTDYDLKEGHGPRHCRRQHRLVVASGVAVEGYQVDTEMHEAEQFEGVAMSVKGLTLHQRRLV